MEKIIAEKGFKTFETRATFHDQGIGEKPWENLDERPDCETSVSRGQQGGVKECAMEPVEMKERKGSCRREGRVIAAVKIKP